MGVLATTSFCTFEAMFEFSVLKNKYTQIMLVLFVFGSPCSLSAHNFASRSAVKVLECA